MAAIFTTSTGRWAGATSEWFQDSYLDVDQRGAFLQIAFPSVPALVVHTRGGRIEISHDAQGRKRRFPERIGLPNHGDRSSVTQPNWDITQIGKGADGGSRLGDGHRSRSA